jgi:hypothetical protein
MGDIMNIKFVEYEKVEGEKANGDIWEAYVIYGTKTEDGDAWKSGNIFDNKYNLDVIKP